MASSPSASRTAIQAPTTALPAGDRASQCSGTPGLARLRPDRALLVLALLLEVALLGLVHLGNLRRAFGPYLALTSAATGLQLLALAVGRSLAPGRRAFALVVGPAVLFRTTLLALGSPSLSGDIHRYVLDGAVLASGHDPYRHAPASPERERWRALADRVDHGTIPTVYPPLAEVVFAAGASVRPDERAVRAAIVAGEIGLLLAAARALRRRGSPPAALLVWAWSPLVLVETALEGHLDALAIGTFVLALLHLSDGRKNLSTLLLATSALLKLFALAGAVAVARRLGPARLAAVAGLFALGWAPFLGHDPGAGLRAYASSWEANAPLFGGLVAALDEAGTTAVLKRSIAAAEVRFGGESWMRLAYAHVYPQEVARWLVGLVFAAAAVALGWRGADPLRGGAALVLAFLLLTPTLHPWYALWGLAFVPVGRSRALFALAAVVPLAHAAAAAEAAGGPWRIPAWVGPAEFLPLAAALAADVAGRRFGLEASER